MKQLILDKLEKYFTLNFLIGFIMGALIMFIASCLIINSICNNIIELLKDY